MPQLQSRNLEQPTRVWITWVVQLAALGLEADVRLSRPSMLAHRGTEVLAVAVAVAVGGFASCHPSKTNRRYETQVPVGEVGVGREGRKGAM